ncbi:MAG TPA: Hsp70 family protein [Candidatus Eremiobacteraeota bacterium]|nr:MAG: Chaperone protein DnaK [bacterium ADurb.Bin363]HPZ07425.1 Hsp70 family protein [Candidatus Eremiobacteraeota bacterium]
MNLSKYIVSIDLGTTNCAVAYASIKELKSEKPDIHFFHIPQLIEKAEVADMSLLPSFLYLPGKYDVSPEECLLPWESDEKLITGEYAKKLGRLIPGRLVMSAKSWLCHGGVDRTAKILPWSGSEDLEKISPLEASKKYLEHIKRAWNFKIAREDPEKKLENQDIIITVPASFNEVARALTVKAAYMAGLERITLLEEPQAAFYSWLTSYESSLKRFLGRTELIIVCDVGGGTTDFSLIHVEKDGEEINLKRIAVGEHILLGGDNMDLAIAKYIERGFKSSHGNLDNRQWGTLCQESQKAKEYLLEEEGTENFSIIIPGTGSRLIGGMLQSEISRTELLQIILEGFFPFSDRTVSEKTSRYGIQEWGLPYATDPAITHHLASFLRSHITENLKYPDAILFNGGALKPSIIRNRILEILNSWSERNKPVKVLINKNMDLTVARGGVYYGLTRKGRGIRIKGGTPRSYYIGIDIEKDKKEQIPSSICLIPRDLEEGQEVIITDREFTLLVGQPISFPLYSSTIRAGHKAGEIVTIDNSDFSELPPLYTLLKTEDKSLEIPVYLKAMISEVGTLALSCITPDHSKNWELEFNLRLKSEEKTSIHKPVRTETVKKIKKLIYEIFTKKPGRITSKDIRPKNLFSHIEKMIGKNREVWDTGFIRELWETLEEIKDKRRSSPEYEASWLNAAGFTLRPGFGCPLDEWRIQNLWSIFSKGLQHNREIPVRLEWWILWRRVAGGLTGEWQEELFNKAGPYLLTGRKELKPFSGPPPVASERLEMLRMVVSLEELDQAKKLQLGELITGRFRKEANPGNTYWLLARLGTRFPFTGTIHKVLPGKIVSSWIEQILTLKWEDKDAVAFGLASLARYTGDRARDISPEVREKVIKRMRKEKCQEIYIKPVETIIEVQSEEKILLFGESLPIGLRVK